MGDVANLLLARATARAKEVAVRVSLGSTRAQLVRRFLTESLMLAFLGGALGLAVAWWGRRLLLSAFPVGNVTVGYDLSLDGRVLAFTFVLTLAAGLVFGLVPALKASRSDVVSELKDLPARGGGRLVLCGPVRPGYFETLGIPLLRGRTFARTDTADSQKVVIINQAMAELFWPDEDPVGQHFHFHGLEAGRRLRNATRARARPRARPTRHPRRAAAGRPSR